MSAPLLVALVGLATVAAGRALLEGSRAPVRSPRRDIATPASWTASAAPVTGSGAPSGAVRRGLASASRLLGPLVRQRRLRRRDEQLAPWLERMASGLRAGLSLTGALAATVATTPQPLRAELVELDRAVRTVGLEVGLGRWVDQAEATPAVTLVAGALDLGVTAGGEVARAVDRVAATLRDRIEAQAEVRALATQARASAVVLGVAPLGFCALLATVEPAVLGVLVTTPLGWGCLVAGLALEAAGAVWMTRIVGGER